MAMPADWKKDSDSEKENTEDRPKKVKIGAVVALVNIMTMVFLMYMLFR